MLLQRAGGGRSLSLALFITCVFAFYLMSPSSHWTPKPSSPPNHPSSQAPPSEPKIESIRPEVFQHAHTNPESLPKPSEPTSPPAKIPRCSVKKVSMLYGAHKFSQLEEALDLHRQHSERWGCAFESLDRDLSNRKLYSKHYFLLSTMLHELSKPEEERQEWLLWVDADSIILNPALSPCVFLPPEDLHDVYALVTADHNGLNNGVFYIKVHPSSVDLLTKVIDYPLAHPEDDLGWFGEQAAMAKVIKSVEAEHQSPDDPTGIAWIPRTWINNYEWEHGFEGEPGSFMVHFAGLAETRLSHMQAWIDELRQNKGKWEIPLDQMALKDAIPTFWDEYRAKSTKNT